jgi:hypothetical protein
MVEKNPVLVVGLAFALLSPLLFSSSLATNELLQLASSNTVRL